MKKISEYLAEGYRDKYATYKPRWRKLQPYSFDLELSESFVYEVFEFPNDTGFCIDLLDGNRLVGQYHYFIDPEFGEVASDVEIDADYQHRGFGKIMLLLAIDVANSLVGDFHSDRRGTTDAQKRVYQSLRSSGIVDESYRIADYTEAQNLINSIIATHRGR
jgi:GNAT superfamily N-acetyltransferase